MGDQEEDYTKLPLADRFQHKVWKVRKEGYEAAAKEMEEAEDASSPAFKPFMFDPGLMKGAVADSNVAAQQEGLRVLCIFMKNGAGECATKTRPLTLGPIIEKGVPSTRAGVKQHALEALMLYVEITKPDLVIEEIMGVFGHKQPKVIAAALSALTQIFHAFGVKIVDPKPVLQALPKVFGHSDKNVRAEATNLCVELYRWLKDSMKPLFWGDLKDLQQQELDKKFEAVKAEPSPKQERLTRAQQIAAARADEREEEVGPAAEGGEEEVEDAGGDDEEPMAISINVLAKTPPDFLENLASSKWKDRKEALEAFHAVANVPKIDPGQYDDIVSALAKCMKDANIMVVTVAANCVEDLSKGLRRDFAKYRSKIMNPMLERLKEKKQAVADALGAALDGVFLATSLSECLEEILEFLKHKNPQVKQETLRFLIRCLRNTRTPPANPEVKSIADAGTKMMTESTASTRDGGAEVVGTLMKIMGDKPMIPFLEPLDDIRKAKVKEFCDAAEVKAKNKPKPPPAAKPTTRGPPPAAKKTVVRKGAPGLGAKKLAPAAAPRPATPPAEPTPPPAPKSVPKTRLGPPGKTGLGAPGTLGLKKKLAGPGGGPAPNLASPARRNLSGVSNDEEPAAAPPQPRLGLGRGLAGRPLAKPSAAPVEAPAPAVLSGLTAIERAELDELRASKASLGNTIDDLRSQVSKQESDINQLRTHEAELIEERTRNRLTIKAKETQLVRARSDAEVAEEQVQRQQREIDRLKRELSRTVRATSPPPADVSDQIYRDAGLGSNGGRITPAGYDRYESARASREVGYQRARNYMSSPSEEKENGILDVSLGKARSPPVSRSPARFGNGGAASEGRGSSRGETSPRESTDLGDVQRGEDGQPIESWRRAAEVTSQLKARIEQMKKRQGIVRP